MRVTLSRKYIKASEGHYFELRVDLFKEGEKHFKKDLKLTYKVKKTYQDFIELHKIVETNPKYQKLLKRGLPSIVNFQT
jgi:hypothetical protein